MQGAAARRGRLLTFWGSGATRGVPNTGGRQAKRVPHTPRWTCGPCSLHARLDALVGLQGGHGTLGARAASPPQPASSPPALPPTAAAACRPPGAARPGGRGGGGRARHAQQVRLLQLRRRTGAAALAVQLLQLPGRAACGRPPPPPLPARLLVRTQQGHAAGRGCSGATVMPSHLACTAREQQGCRARRCAGGCCQRCQRIPMPPLPSHPLMCFFVQDPIPVAATHACLPIALRCQQCSMSPVSSPPMPCRPAAAAVHCVSNGPAWQQVLEGKDSATHGMQLWQRRQARGAACATWAAAARTSARPRWTAAGSQAPLRLQHSPVQPLIRGASQTATRQQRPLGAHEGQPSSTPPARGS